MSEYYQRIKEVLITEEEIKEAVKKVGKEISEEYKGKKLLVVGILKGSFMFIADLVRAITEPCEIAFMRAKSYFDSTESSGEVKILADLDHDISDYHVIIAEDIVDTGRTLKGLIEILKARNPLSLKVVAFLDKPDRRVVDFKADKVLFTIPDKFVIGYGLDYDEKYRGLPYLGVYGE